MNRLNLKFELKCKTINKLNHSRYRMFDWAMAGTTVGWDTLKAKPSKMNAVLNVETYFTVANKKRIGDIIMKMLKKMD